MEKNKNTIVINIFGGPSAGKTTVAWKIASDLKIKRYSVEYVPEYAKELVWDERYDLLDGSINSQKIIYQEQLRRLKRLIGKVDYIVTDSPILLRYVYLDNKRSPESIEFINNMLNDYKLFNNKNIYIKRADYFEKEGRIHTKDESINIDKDIKKFLNENNILFKEDDFEKYK